MTPEQFSYWLQGFVEMNGGKMPTEGQWKAIQEHLATVFKKVTLPVEEPKKAESDLERSLREYAERSKTMPHYPQPNWWQPQWTPGQFPPGTIIC